MDTVLSILVLAAIALLWGAYALWRRGGSRKQVALMVVMAAVLAANVAIWVVPGAGSSAPVSTELK
jgi:hypothetical protein